MKSKFARLALFLFAGLTACAQRNDDTNRNTPMQMQRGYNGAYGSVPQGGGYGSNYGSGTYGNPTYGGGYGSGGYGAGQVPTGGMGGSYGGGGMPAPCYGIYISFVTGTPQQGQCDGANCSGYTLINATTGQQVTCL